MATSRSKGTEKVSLVLVGQAVESLRQSDFDTCSAIGEAIDNSLQASATEIHIVAKEHELPVRGRRGVGVKTILDIAIGDNGSGMDRETLHHCMQLGYSTRYNERAGIGRFGVGMTLAAINQCKRIEVFSRAKAKAPWLWTYVDLDESEPFISKPIEKDIPKAYSTLVGKTGALVTWSKIDVRTSTPEEVRHWIARTYRKFIGKHVVRDKKVVENENPVLITYNHEPIDAFDPLFAIRSSLCPEGPVASLYEEISIDMPVPEDSKAKVKTSPVVIRMSLTPEHWRLEGGGKSGRSELAQRLMLGENEGFSILRADREVFYDVMPHFEPKPHPDGFDRWWSAEVTFDPILDEHFSVRNVKRGARFLRELREKIEEKMRPVIQEARRSVDATFKKGRSSATHAGRDATTEHTEAEQTVKAAAPTPGKAGAGKTDDAKKKEIEAILTPIIREANDLAAWTAKIESQPCTILDNESNTWKGPTFIDVHPQGGRTIIEYNMGHDFFLFVYGMIKKLAEPEIEREQALDLAKKLKTALDLLFMSYAQAESMNDLEHTQKIGDTLEMLRNNWGQFLRQFVREYEARK